MEYFRTPVKDLPSLSYGSSSSPQLDPPSSVEPLNRSANIFKSSPPAQDFQTLLPPHNIDFHSLTSSPPVVRVNQLETPKTQTKTSKTKREPQIFSPHVPKYTTQSPLRLKLHSSQAFKNALESQKRISKKPVPSKMLNKRSPLEVSINTKGHVSVQKLPLMPPHNSPNHLHNVRTALELLGEDSEEEISENLNENMKTPPRFSNLGSCDATAAFARSFTRTRELGKCSMFMFPSPRKSENHSVFVQHTPRTPKTPNNRRSIQDEIQTPPGAIFGYESIFGTGMTPFIGSAQR